MNRRAIIVIDLQNEYLADGKLPLVGMESAVANAARIIGAARARGEPVIHVLHENPGSKATFFMPGTPGVGIIPQVGPTQGEQVVVKHHPNAFRDTQLQETLRAQDVGAVVVLGAMSHMCVDATARASADLGYEVTVVEDACATMDINYGARFVSASQVHAAHVAALAFAYASVVSTDTLLSG
ncbi:cysteine hydrolase [Luteimonas marina]|uniref:Cysteine hydrolase n=1 Tax=Luteimonas marina TaxID=488485 RepID=A0A5C5U6A5_9GAMM|nr:cysteine hydrolase family protein [Luteimonas marina]TWT21416.1 cysteine hydrolase [Luteimonas marina]